MKKFLKILSNLFFIFAVLAVVFAIFITVKAKREGNEVYVFGYKPFMIATGSMEPTLKVRGFVMVKDVPYEEIKEGDIISFIPEEINKSVCHRVVQITDEGFITKGDNNFSNDMGTVSKEEFTGKLIFSSNAYANAYYVITEGNTFVVIGIFGALIVGIILAVVAIKYLKNSKPEKNKK